MNRRETIKLLSNDSDSDENNMRPKIEIIKSTPKVTFINSPSHLNT